ncbi:hypothetical protein Tco_0232778 [Tanacetum coccineum]
MPGHPLKRAEWCAFPKLQVLNLIHALGLEDPLVLRALEECKGVSEITLLIHGNVAGQLPAEKAIILGRVAIRCLMFQQPKFLQGHISHKDIRDLRDSGTPNSCGSANKAMSSIPSCVKGPPATLNIALQIEVASPLALEYRKQSMEILISVIMCFDEIEPPKNLSSGMDLKQGVKQTLQMKLTSNWSPLLTVVAGGATHKNGYYSLVY